ncbi:non-ribosomal peptide synthetase [Variovorax sp. WS11]|uniref:non-ribosomal peptide synthetase n=1 Tax=Variovorax sp. WS11 TaxID=1105204 RepID=UPI0013D9B1E8|nr:non-ribosomal peptide synthetase [Variovorax sp. WS11]NDZ18109.1 amino acid adenylation domain-containing protein [Variovorax sp. WS11]
MNNDLQRQIAERFARLPAERKQGFLKSLREQGIDFSVLPIVPAPGGESQPASYAQARQWFLWKFDAASTAYHISGALRLEGELDADAVDAAFGALVARHAALRTRFEAQPDGMARQVAQPALALHIPRTDLRGLDAPARDAAAKAEALRITQTPFDLTAGPLLRVGLIRISELEHLLVIAMHHIVSDGWSMQLLVEEFAALYGAHREGRPPALPAPPIQYADYAAWQRHWLEAGEKERQLAYWTRQLGHDHPVLQLPAGHPRRADGRYRAATGKFELPAELAQAVRRRAQAQGATLFMALLAGFHALLHRYTDQADIRTGMPIANRHRPETERVVGFFVNTQVLRTEVGRMLPLAALLDRVKEAVQGAQAHQDLPFEQLVEALQPDRSLGHSPLFQVVHNHQQVGAASAVQLPGLALHGHALNEQAAQFELTLDTTEDAQGRVGLVMTYAEELFAPATIERLASHYLAMLEALAQRPEQTVGEVVLQGAEELARTRQWGDAALRGVQPAEPIHHRIEAQARARPEAVAVVCEGEALSYAELNARANRLAHRLVAMGVRPESRVGIAMPRSAQMIVGLLAILKAGGAYVPLDPDYPAERLAYMAADSGITLLLTDSAVLPRLAVDAALPVLEIDRADAFGDDASEPAVAVHPDHLAYVIYTSGSTGRPKGAQLCHRQVSRLLDATAPWFRFGPEDVWTMFHSYAFDFSVWEIFGALCTGGRLVVVPYWVSRSPEDFLALLREQQVTVLNQTPSAFRQLMHAAGARDATTGLALRCVVFGGEALEPESLRPWIERHGDAMPALINMYGITETTVHVTWRPITRADLADGQRSPVGVAIPDLGLRVLDADLREQPVGVPGELHVSGAGLARGYLNRAALSSERFVADPFDTQGGRLYRTGDLVRWRGDGQLEYLGRIDHQVKIRGFRIELGEIEAQLQSQPGVREVAVLAQEGPGGARLVGYVAGEAEPTALKRALSAVLPEYMVPSVIMVLDALPLNANGKIDRKALPQPEAGTSAGYEAPVGEAEQAVAALWAELLGVPRVGRHDSFFELGGHSLLAIQLLERLRQQGREAPVRLLFQQPRLAEFAAALEGGDGASRRAVVVPPNGIPGGCTAITPAMLPLVALDDAQIRRIEAAVPGGAANIQDIYPLAPLQEGILFHHLMQAEGDAYVTTLLLGFDSEPRLRRFLDSLARVITRHDILRTAVLWEDLPSPVQVVWREAPLPLSWFAPEAGGGAVADQLNAHVHASRYRIDVRQAPLIRGIAARDEENGRWLLQLPTHHLALDHTSEELLVEEIALLLQGREAELPEPVPFRNYVAQARLGASAAEHEAFFRGMLADVDEPTAPFGLADVRIEGAQVIEERCLLDGPAARALREQAQRHGVSAATVFHLAWALVLGRTTGRDDVVFGTVLFGRMQGGEGAHRALGMFINTLPLRLRLGEGTVAQCLQQANAALADLLHHEHAPLSLAQRCSGLPGAAPLFSTIFNYRHAQVADPEGQNAIWAGMEMLGAEERTNYPFTVSINDRGEAFELVLQVHRPGQRAAWGMLQQALG